jgi:hypothetical protein
MGSKGQAALAALAEKHGESQDELIARLTRENEALKAASTGTLSLKVSSKGGVSAYGLGRWPVTLYKEQWEKLLNAVDQIRAFIVAHDAELKTKTPAGE